MSQRATLGQYLNFRADGSLRRLPVAQRQRFVDRRCPRFRFGVPLIDRTPGHPMASKCTGRPA